MPSTCLRSVLDTMPYFGRKRMPSAGRGLYLKRRAQNIYQGSFLLGPSQGQAKQATKTTGSVRSPNGKLRGQCRPDRWQVLQAACGTVAGDCAGRDDIMMRISELAQDQLRPAACDEPRRSEQPVPYRPPADLARIVSSAPFALAASILSASA